MDINTLLNTLDDWRCLPAYQLERRADIFFALHIKELFKKLYDAEIDLVLPEFPIRKGSLPNDVDYNNKSAKNYKPNQSFKIDYLVCSKSNNLVYFIELKTDVSSRNKKQDWYLEKAKELGMSKILEDLKEIYKASDRKGRIKYKHLFSKLNDLGWIKGIDENFNLLLSKINIEKRYIQPTFNENEINKESIITYEKIIKNLDDSKEPLTKRFLESLEKWQTECKK